MQSNDDFLDQSIDQTLLNKGSGKTIERKKKSPKIKLDTTNLGMSKSKSQSKFPGVFTSRYNIEKQHESSKYLSVLQNDTSLDSFNMITRDRRDQRTLDKIGNDQARVKA